MYIPKHFKNENQDQIFQFMKEHSFATLISMVDHKPWATHTPIIFSERKNNDKVLFGHISKANPQWKNFTNDSEVLIIFQGPNAYISSSWYDYESVPTWNYIAIHVYGSIKIVEGQECIAHMNNLMKYFEKGQKNPQSIATISPNYLNKEIQGIVGFEITITDIQAQEKLSQNQNTKNQKAIINQLETDTKPCEYGIITRMKNNNLDDY